MKKNSFQETDYWRRGNSTVLFFIVAMWIVVVAATLFMEYYNMFSHVGKTQIYADIVADGAAFIGNNGWGLDEGKAKKAASKLSNYNKKNFEDISVNIGFSATNSDGSKATYKVSGKNKNNTVNATAKLKTSMITRNTAIMKNKKASTHITYSGGLKVVLEAYKHSYEYCGSEHGQTWYTWGGGHGIPNNSDAWEQFADCSGFVSGVFRKCGYNVSSDAYTGTLETTGQTVATSYDGLYRNARPGDIILYWRGGENGAMQSQHVTIYAGEHNGRHYQIHSQGGEHNTSYNPGKGRSGGVHITEIEYGASRIQVQRIVNSEAAAEKVPTPKIAGLTKNESIIYLRLKEYGFTNACIAAILGNWSGESGNNPIMREEKYANPAACEAYAQKIRNSVYKHNGRTYTKLDFALEGVGRMTMHPYSEGFGLGQWTTVDLANPLNDRKARLWDYATRMGSDVTNIDAQISYAIYEFNHVRADFNTAYFSSMTDVNQATEYFMRHFEGIIDGSLPTRQARARVYYSRLR